MICWQSSITALICLLNTVPWIVIISLLILADMHTPIWQIKSILCYVSSIIYFLRGKGVHSQTNINRNTYNASSWRFHVYITCLFRKTFNSFWDESRHDCLEMCDFYLSNYYSHCVFEFYLCLIGLTHYLELNVLLSQYHR